MSRKGYHTSVRARSSWCTCGIIINKRNLLAMWAMYSNDASLRGPECCTHAGASCRECCIIVHIALPDLDPESRNAIATFPPQSFMQCMRVFVLAALAARSQQASAPEQPSCKPRPHERNTTMFIGTCFRTLVPHAPRIILCSPGRPRMAAKHGL